MSLGLRGRPAIESIVSNSETKRFYHTLLNFFFYCKAFETKLIIKKLIRTENNLYALGKLRNELINKNVNNKEIIESQQLSLYKLLINDQVKANSLIEHQLVVSGLTVNEEKMLIAIDNDVETSFFFFSFFFFKIN